MEDNNNPQSSGSEDCSDEGLNGPSVRLEDATGSLNRRNSRWFRTPSILISLLAVVVTGMASGITYWATTKESHFQKLQQMGQVIDQISALATEESELYRTSVPSNVRVGAASSIANRRAVLIRQVDRLLADVDETSVAKLDLALLAPAYASVGRYEIAEKYFLDLAQSEDEPLIPRIMAWRSLVFLYGSQGPERVDDAKQAAAKGLALIDDKEGDILLKGELALIPYVLATTFLMSRNFKEAFGQLIEAERETWAALCTPMRQEVLKLVQADIKKILATYPEGQLKLNESRLAYPPACPSDPPLPFNVLSAEENGSDDLLSDYVAEYKFDNGNLLSLQNVQGVLTATVGGNPPLKLVNVSSDIFSILMHPGFYLVFQRGSTGLVSHVVSLQPDGSYVGLRN